MHPSDPLPRYLSGRVSLSSDMSTHRFAVAVPFRAVPPAPGKASARPATEHMTRLLTVPGVRGGVAYRAAGRHLVQLGGPLAPNPDYDHLLEAFLADAAAEGRRVVAIRLQGHDVSAYVRHGFHVRQVGHSYALDLARHAEEAAGLATLRLRTLSARRSGLVVDEAEPSAEHPLRRTFHGRANGGVVATIGYVPAFGTRPGWARAVTHRDPSAPRGTLEAVNAAAITAMQAEGARWLHFGFASLAALDRAVEDASTCRAIAEALNPTAEAGARRTRELTDVLTLRPRGVLPEYVAFQGQPGPPAVSVALRLALAC
jgi:lysylphosphatidylglycerol synthetase-like protein (DUF2156 family)